MAIRAEYFVPGEGMKLDSVPVSSNVGAGLASAALSNGTNRFLLICPRCRDFMSYGVRHCARCAGSRA